MKQKKILSTIGTVFFTILCFIWVLPVLIVLMDSFKSRTFISLEPFAFPTDQTFVGLENYVQAIDYYGFLDAVGWTVFITVGSVFVILLCCSMCAWFITRVANRFTRGVYLLCVLSMVVPFQMVMFTLSSLADSMRINFFDLYTLRFNTPWMLWFVYLGFGAGLAVFMFCGFMKSVPIEIEEASMIDGCNPIQTYFKVVFPLLKPTMVSVAILEAMWIWNDYLLPTLILDIDKYKTISMLIQYFRGSYGRVEMGPMMACIMLAILPIIIVYLAGQKYIIKGVVSGAVKG